MARYCCTFTTVRWIHTERKFGLIKNLWVFLYHPSKELANHSNSPSGLVHPNIPSQPLYGISPVCISLVFSLLASQPAAPEKSLLSTPLQLQGVWWGPGLDQGDQKCGILILKLGMEVKQIILLLMATSTLLFHFRFLSSALLKMSGRESKQWAASGVFLGLVICISFLQSFCPQRLHGRFRLFAVLPSFFSLFLVMLVMEDQMLLFLLEVSSSCLLEHCHLIKGGMAQGRRYGPSSGNSFFIAVIKYFTRLLFWFVFRLQSYQAFRVLLSST